MSDINVAFILIYYKSIVRSLCLLLEVNIVARIRHGIDREQRTS
jgi:hypothetical protein